MNTLRPCGTLAAYRRHRRAGRTPCGPCFDAYNADQRRRRADRHIHDEEPFTGTWVRKGLVWHPKEAA